MGVYSTPTIMTLSLILGCLLITSVVCLPQLSVDYSYDDYSDYPQYPDPSDRTVHVILPNLRALGILAHRPRLPAATPAPVTSLGRSLGFRTRKRPSFNRN